VCCDRPVSLDGGGGGGVFTFQIGRGEIMIQEKLLEKSKEAFVMAIEIYNKPTIVYRVEGFSFLYAMHGS